MAADDNKEILTLLNDRLKIGKERYGHGVIVDDDTRQYGTADDNWETMMMEEALDGMIYAAAQLVRLKRIRAQKQEEEHKRYIIHGERDDYTIVKNNNNYTCSCPDFVYRYPFQVDKSDGCKHIRNLNES